MSRAILALVVLAIFLCGTLLQAQTSQSQQDDDLQVQFRSATGSNRFQVGEVIPLEVLFSSSSPNRYLEPCELFIERSFGFPQCRFANRWEFIISPPPHSRWVDYTKEFPRPMSFGGPTFEVPSRNLTSEPAKFPYELTKRFRFDSPGEYHVWLTTYVGIDDGTTQRPRTPAERVQPNAVRVARELVLQIIPANRDWQRDIVRKGEEAYFGPTPRVTDPPSAEMLNYQHATRALCVLGTPEAARVLANALTRQDRHVGKDLEIADCLMRSPSTDAAIEAMHNMLVDPDVAIGGVFFDTLVAVQRKDGSHRENILPPELIREERDRLLAALPNKRGDSHVQSLITVLQYPEPRQTMPFPPSVITAAAMDFDQFSEDVQRWLLRDGWERLRSPLMLPLLRRKAAAGNGDALLRWLEIDPGPARVFVRDEVVRPLPRFSSHYLRLPEASLPDQERQIATNFVALTGEFNLAREASLLHRYATRKVLPIVLPFIESHLAAWPYSVRVPSLAYLLKVDPEEADVQIERMLAVVNRTPWEAASFFNHLGTLQRSPVLDRLAIAQIDRGSESAAGAARYLRRYGESSTKPLVWEQLQRWHAWSVDGGAEKRRKEQKFNPDDEAKRELLHALAQAYAEAQGWVLSPAESDALKALLGSKMSADLFCEFGCGLTTFAPTSSTHAIYRGVNNSSDWQQNPALEYLNPRERRHYSVSQYRCNDLDSLKQKLVQFPAGSAFAFTSDFTLQDREDMVEISDFLKKHGYFVFNP